MNRKKIIPLVISLGSALAVLFMAMRFMSHGKTAAVTPKRPQYVVAKAAIEAGNPLTDDQLVMGDVAADAVPETMFRSIDDVRGRILNVALVIGQPVSTHVLEPKGAGIGLQAVLRPGERAITVEINELSGVAGNVLTGSHVDIIETLHEDKAGDAVTRTIAQNVRIAAVGMRHNQGEPGDGRSVTLIVTPEQAELVELASQSGRPRLSLRNANDLDRKDIPSIRLADLMGSGKKEDPFSFVHVVMSMFTQRTATGTPTTRPAFATTQPSVADEWTIKVVRGGAESDVKFPLHHPEETEVTGTDMESK